MPTSITASKATLARVSDLMVQYNTGFNGCIRTAIDAPAYTKEGVALARAEDDSTGIPQSISLDADRIERLDKMAATLAPLMPNKRPNRSRTVAILVASVWLRDFKPRTPQEIAAADARVVAMVQRMNDPVLGPADRRAAFAVYADKQLAAQEAKRAKQRQYNRTHRAKRKNAVIAALRKPNNQNL
jgi:hypothetical protein